MTAGISFIPGKTGGHRPPLQLLDKNLNLYRIQLDPRELFQQQRVGAFQVGRVLGFQCQLDGIHGIIEVGIGAEHEIRESCQDSMEYSRDLSFIRTKKNLLEVKRRLAEHLFDTFEFTLQNLRDSWKNVDILYRNDREPHSFSADEPRALRYVGHPQIGFNRVRLVILPERGFEVGMTPDSASKGTGNSLHCQIIVSRSNSTCGKYIIIGV